MSPSDRPCVWPPPASPVYAGALERSLGLQLRRILSLLTSAIEQRMEPLGLTDAQWKPLLRLLLYAPESVSASALARDCHMDNGGMTRLLDRLQAKGLCVRERSESDRRVVLIALTPAGREVAEQLPTLMEAVQAQLLAGFDTAEETQLRQFLQRVHTNVQALDKKTNQNTL